MNHEDQELPPVNPYFALAVGIAAVSTGAIFARLAEAPALTVAAYRVGFSALVLIPLALWRAGDEFKRLSGRDIKLAVLSGVFLALHFATWISSLDYTAVSNSVVLVNTNPLWVALLTPLVTGERMRRAAMGCVVLSVVGGGLIAAQDLAIGGQSLMGDGLALAGGMSTAVYLLLGRNLRRKLSLLAYVTICYTTAALILWLVVLVAGLPVTGFSGQTWVFLVGLALVSQLMGHTSYNWALKWFSAGLIAVSLLGEPILGTLLAWILFDEGLTWLKLAGGAVILTAICLTVVVEKK